MSTYTKEHYTQLAAILADVRSNLGHSIIAGDEALDAVEDRLTDLFAQDNPRFNGVLFHRAANPERDPIPYAGPYRTGDPDAMF